MPLILSLPANSGVHDNLKLQVNLKFQAHNLGRMRPQPEQGREAGKVERDLPEAERDAS